jgi:hypothetical protein
MTSDTYPPSATSRTVGRDGFARRHRRQNLALLVSASVLGVWLGTGAPGVSPVAPATPAVQSSVAPATAPSLAAVAPAIPSGGRFGGRGDRR